MSDIAIVDFINPTVAALLITALWAGCASPLTCLVAKRTKHKVFAAAAGWVAMLTVMLVALAAGGFAGLVYWVGFKGVDINERFHPEPMSTPYTPILDPRVWAILAPIIGASVLAGMIAYRWKKAGEKFGLRLS